jgi:hypothetical protein
MKIQTKAIVESNRLVSARLSSLKELVGDTGNNGDGDDAYGKFYQGRIERSITADAPGPTAVFPTVSPPSSSKTLSLRGESSIASTFKSKKKVKQYSRRKHKSKINQVTLFGDEPIMSVIPEKTKSTSKIKSTTSISSQSSTTVETVEDEEDSALEKLIDSTEDDLDDVIAYKSLATVTLPDFVVSGIATSDVFGDDYYGNDHEANCDETVTAGINKLGNNNETLFYDVARAQIYGGAKVSVTNLLALLLQQEVQT